MINWTQSVQWYIRITIKTRCGQNTVLKLLNSSHCMWMSVNTSDSKKHIIESFIDLWKTNSLMCQTPDSMAWLRYIHLSIIHSGILKPTVCTITWCNIPAQTTLLVFEPGLIAHSAGKKLAGRLDCHTGLYNNLAAQFRPLLSRDRGWQSRVNCIRRYKTNIGQKGRAWSQLMVTIFWWHSAPFGCSPHRLMITDKAFNLYRRGNRVTDKACSRYRSEIYDNFKLWEV